MIKRDIFCGFLMKFIMALSLFSSCIKDDKSEAGDIGFSRLSSLKGKTFTAYTSFSYDRDDTISLSFDYTGAGLSALDVKATLDSGATWKTVDGVIPATPGKATALWVPMNSTASDFDYFGPKKAYIRISHPESGKLVHSDTFDLIGRSPITLVSPLEGEFKASDIVKIRFSGNLDLISHTMVFFKTPSMPDWLELADSEPVDSPSLVINSTITTFVPGDYAAVAGNFAEPIKILVADYGPNSAQILSGDITIIP